MTGNNNNTKGTLTMTKTTNNTVDTSVENLSRLCKVAAEMRAAGDEAGCQMILAAMHRALGIA